MDPQIPRTIARVFGGQFRCMRYRFRRSVGLAAILGLSLVILAPAAVAQDEAGSDGDDHVILTGGLVVPEGETAKTAVVFNGDVLIDGTVSETLVVFNGRTEITGTVDEDVVVFNGSVVLRSGSRVGGDVVSRQAPQIEDGATVEGSIDDLGRSGFKRHPPHRGRDAPDPAGTLRTVPRRRSSFARRMSGSRGSSGSTAERSGRSRMVVFRSILICCTPPPRSQ